MKVPESLSKAFGAEFEQWITQFAIEQELLPDADSLQSPRYVSRSIVPHVVRLSTLFNRIEKNPGDGLDPYWKESSNPQQFRLAYFLYFMPSNLFRVASIWSELCRLGFRWSSSTLRGIEFGAGPATGACGIAAGETYSPVGLPTSGNWALIEQDKAILELGTQWAQTYFSHLKLAEWGIRPFHRKIDIPQGFLPPAAPKFNLWLMSFYLNETTLSAEVLAGQLIKSWAQHLDDESIIILVEPALKIQSRRLLELRKALISHIEKMENPWLQVLLPCLGHQACGALSNPEDWCHEEVTWWRPPYFKKIDQMAGLDRKTLPFSYLVLAKTRRSREELLPALARSEKDPTLNRFRLVSPAHWEGKDQEFFLCGPTEKKRARYRTRSANAEETELERGDILLGADLRGDTHSSRVEKFEKKI